MTSGHPSQAGGYAVGTGVPASSTHTGPQHSRRGFLARLLAAPAALLGARACVPEPQPASVPLNGDPWTGPPLRAGDVQAIHASGDYLHVRTAQHGAFAISKNGTVVGHNDGTVIRPVRAFRAWSE